MLKVKLLCLGFGRNRGEVTEVVVFTAIGDGFEIFGVPTVGDADTCDLGLTPEDRQQISAMNGKKWLQWEQHFYEG